MPAALTFYRAVCGACLGLVLAACQSTSGAESLQQKYAVAIDCIKSTMYSEAISLDASDEVLRSRIYSGFEECTDELNDYIVSLERRVMRRNNWTSLKKEAKVAITDNVLTSTSIALQQEFRRGGIDQ